MVIDYEIIKNNFFIIYDYHSIFFDDKLPDKIRSIINIFTERKIILIIKLDMYFKHLLSLKVNDKYILQNQLDLIFDLKKIIYLSILVEMNNYQEFKIFNNLIDIIMIQSYQSKEEDNIKKICYDNKIILIKNNIFGSNVSINFLHNLINSFDNYKIITCESSKTNYIEIPDYLKRRIFESSLSNNNTLTCIDISDIDLDLPNYSINSNNLNIRNIIPILSNIFCTIEINGIFLNNSVEIFDFFLIEKILNNLNLLIKN